MLISLQSVFASAFFSIAPDIFLSSLESVLASFYISVATAFLALTSALIFVLLASAAATLKLIEATNSEAISTDIRLLMTNSMEMINVEIAGA